MEVEKGWDIKLWYKSDSRLKRGYNLMEIKVKERDEDWQSLYIAGIWGVMAKVRF